MLYPVELVLIGDCKKQLRLLKNITEGGKTETDERREMGQGCVTVVVVKQMGSKIIKESDSFCITSQRARIALTSRG